MIVNPHGWRKRYIAAQVRKEQIAMRQDINAQRWAHYNADEAKPVDEPVDEAVVEPSYDDMPNAALREALAEKGFEVPKTTARTRLIELYQEHVEGV